jgi:hypothetical protein
MSAREFSNFSSRTSNTASNVQDLVSILDTDFGGEVVFVTRNGLVERFCVCETAEMERLSPAVLVEIGPKVVVTGNRKYGISYWGNGTYCLVRVAYSAFRAYVGH